MFCGQAQSRRLQSPALSTGPPVSEAEGQGGTAGQMDLPCPRFSFRSDFSSQLTASSHSFPCLMRAAFSVSIRVSAHVDVSAMLPWCFLR